MEIVLIALNVVSGLLLVAFILMHSGKDAGLSGFATGGGGSSAVTVERNLNRLTIAVALVWVLSTVLIARGM